MDSFLFPLAIITNIAEPRNLIAQLQWNCSCIHQLTYQCFSVIERHGHCHKAITTTITWLWLWHVMPNGYLGRLAQGCANLLKRQSLQYPTPYQNHPPSKTAGTWSKTTNIAFFTNMAFFSSDTMHRAGGDMEQNH